MVVTSIYADLNFYGKVNTGVWYVRKNANFTTTETIFDMNSGLYATSKIGANFKVNNFTAKVEVGLKNQNNIYLRLAYGIYDFGKVKLLFGQDYTGFTSKNYSSQAYLGNSSELANVGIGAFYHKRVPMVKLIFHEKLFISFIQPTKINPAVETLDTIDALIPKINFGLDYKTDDFSIYPTFGFNYSKYSKDRTFQGIDNSVLAYAFATTIKYHNDIFCIKGQVNYGQNVTDYGIIGLNNASAGYDLIEKVVIDSKTLGGFLQFKYNLSKKSNFILGGGYSSSDNDTLDEPDTAMDIFGQLNIRFSKNFNITPEIGYINFMEDGNGINEGTITYFGTRLQANF